MNRPRKPFPNRSSILLAAVLLFPSLARGSDDPAVPVDIQASLLVKVAAYDRALKSRAGDKVRILALMNARNLDSQRFAKSMVSELQGKQIAGLQIETTLVSFKDIATLLFDYRSRQISIIYFAPGLGEELPGIAKALEGGNVLTSSAVADYVSKGAVLGFDLVSGKPQMLVHLKQAQLQNVRLSPQVLELMKVLQ